MTAATETAQLPPVMVSCTRCGNQFMSRARRHVTVRCPGCGTANRVKRDQPASPAGWPPAEPERAVEPPGNAGQQLALAAFRAAAVAAVEPVQLAAPLPAVWVQRELDARDYGLALGLDPREGRCQIIRCRGVTGAQLAEPEPCPGAGSQIISTDYRGRPIRICDRHEQALRAPIPAH
ncbi:MAG: hypothetical protein ACLQI7_02325 [Streptosporangiaceae bacterium]|jgi:hypothetical protein